MTGSLIYAKKQKTNSKSQVKSKENLNSVSATYLVIGIWL